MKNYISTLHSASKPVFIILIVLALFPQVSPALALFAGLAFAFVFGKTYPAFAKKTSKYLLQASVVGLGFGMNLHSAIESGSKGMTFTIVSVIGVMILGTLLGRLLKIERKTSYLISVGTAICGGSAIAAVGPVIKADEDEMSVSLGTIFVLNAIALFIFPPIGHYFGLTEIQFGEWAAIAIHDTSSVVGAGAAYGPQAMEIATLIKCTRALWIIPLLFVTAMIFSEKNSKFSLPWFILFFVLAMVANTYLDLPKNLTDGLVLGAKKGLAVTLFLIGSSLSPAVLKKVGIRPLVQGVALWILIAVTSLIVILHLIK